MLLILSLFTALFAHRLPPRQTPWSGKLSLSQQTLAPSEDGRLYVYLPVQSGRVDCILTVYDAYGRVTARFERAGLTANVHTFIWDVRPAVGNAAGYAPERFVPDGTYTLEALCTSGSDSVRRTASVTVSASAEPALPESGVPNYTGDHETDYMVSRVLEEIPTEGLSTTEKIRAVYTWVQANCYRNGERAT